MSDKTMPGMNSREASAPPRAAVAQAGSLLEASRRVDWRFLLPDPNLGGVVAAGKISASLSESLALFSESLTYWEAPFSDDRYLFQADLVVIGGSLDGDLARALEFVKPGGHVYLEFMARLHTNRFPFRHSLAYNARALKAQGFEDIQGHWHSPNFEGCKRLIPLDDPAALVYALTKTENPAVRWLTREVVFFAHRSGILRWGTRSLSLIARRGAE